MKTIIKQSIKAISIFAISGYAIGQSLAIENPVIRLLAPTIKTTGAFMVIKNISDKEVKIVAAENPASEVTEVHDHLHVDGLMKMVEIPEIVIPAQGEVVLKRGGKHVMLIDLKAPLKEDDVVPITLILENGEKISAPAKVTKF